MSKKNDVQGSYISKVNYYSSSIFHIFGLSYREIEELISIRGVNVDHATIQRWVFKFTPLLEKEFRQRKKCVGKRWRMDETYIKVKGW